MKEHRHVFTTWLMEKDIPTEGMTMKMLASHPSSCMTSWQVYDINGYTYCTKEKDKSSVAQNSGIHIKAFDPLGVKTTYYGYIQDSKFLFPFLERGQVATRILALTSIYE
jgi:hypothetical protein